MTEMVPDTQTTPPVCDLTEVQVTLGPPVRRDDGVLPAGAHTINHPVLYGGEQVGLVGYTVHDDGWLWLHYGVDEQHRRRGYASAALRLLIGHLRDSGRSCGRRIRGRWRRRGVSGSPRLTAPWTTCGWRCRPRGRRE